MGKTHWQLPCKQMILYFISELFNSDWLRLSCKRGRRSGRQPAESTLFRIVGRVLFHEKVVKKLPGRLVFYYLMRTRIGVISVLCTLPCLRKDAAREYLRPFGIQWNKRSSARSVPKLHFVFYTTVINSNILFDDSG